MSEIVSLKLVTGEEVIGTLISTNETSSTINSYLVRKPHVLQFQNMGGRVGLALIPWTLSNPNLDRIEIPASCVVVKFKPSDMTEKQYIQQTTEIALA